MFTLHPQSGVPIYRQLVDQVRRLIAGGQLQPGAELPSVRDLAITHAVNPMTVEAEGLLQRNRGRPMTVVAGRKAQASVAQRLKQLEPHARQLALSARQLELERKDFDALIDRIWESPHDK